MRQLKTVFSEKMSLSRAGRFRSLAEW